VMRAAGAKARLRSPVPQREPPPPRCPPRRMSSPLAILRSHLSRGKRPAPSAHVTPAAPTCRAPLPARMAAGGSTLKASRRWCHIVAAPPRGAALQPRAVSTNVCAASWGRRPPRAARRCANTARSLRSRAGCSCFPAHLCQETCLAHRATAQPRPSPPRSSLPPQGPPQLVRRGACQGGKQGNSLGECTRRLGQPSRRVARARWPRRSDACTHIQATRAGAGLGFAPCCRRLALDNSRLLLFRRCAHSRAPAGSGPGEGLRAHVAGRPTF